MAQKYDYNSLKQLYEIFSPSNREKKMRRHIKRVCTQIGARVEVDKAGNVLVTKGDAESYPCVAAHIDQVQDRHARDFRVIKADDTILGFSPKQREQQGLGADDKNGIWIALEMLRQFDVLKCAFFVGEEIGCVGSSQVDMAFFSDVRFVIQADRRGAHDLITNISGDDLCSAEFLQEINAAKFGYEETHGLMTDVLELSERGVGVSCINFSCGYYDPHTDEETTSWRDLCNARDFAEYIIENCTKVYSHTNVSRYDEVYKGVAAPSLWDNFPLQGATFDVRDYDYIDAETMRYIIGEDPNITADEVVSIYADWFYCTDAQTLRALFSQVREETDSLSPSWYFDNDK